MLLDAIVQKLIRCKVNGSAIKYRKLKIFTSAIYSRLLVQLTLTTENFLVLALKSSVSNRWMESSQISRDWTVCRATWTSRWYNEKSPLLAISEINSTNVHIHHKIVDGIFIVSRQKIFFKKVCSVTFYCLLFQWYNSIVCLTLSQLGEQNM